MLEWVAAAALVAVGIGFFEYRVRKLQKKTVEQQEASLGKQHETIELNARIPMELHDLRRDLTDLRADVNDLNARQLGQSEEIEEVWEQVDSLEEKHAQAVMEIAVEIEKLRQKVLNKKAKRLKQKILLVQQAKKAI